MKAKKWILVIIAILGVLAVVIIYDSYYFAVFSKPTSDPEFVVYKFDEDNYLILGRSKTEENSYGEILTVVKEKKWVCSINFCGNEWKGIIMWPKECICGMVIGDNLKRDESETYEFGNGEVRVHFWDYYTDSFRDLRVPLD